ncbi:MAG: hypothetical protein M3H12_08570 [Chromatiales bacterium]|nr:hypothetical protein [Gammaproteobacteria bacterium]
MRIDYHDLNENQFEQLVIAVCTHLLGLGVQGFSKGPDGGKDARFHGRAERFPSAAAPWDGRIVIQAKHTDLINRKFSEPDFSGDAPSSVLSRELPRIQRLREAGELDYYLLFSNRRLAGVAEEKIRKRIAEAAGIAEQAIFFCGVEALDQYLRLQPDILRWANINPFDSPPIIDPDDLARVIRAFADERDRFSEALDETNPPPEQRVSLADKNRINGLSEDYARIVERYIKDFDPIRAFLAAPENSSYVSLYENTVNELNGLIMAHKQEHHGFDQILEQLYKQLIDRDYDLKVNKRLTRTVLYYMYWNCDLGNDDND